MSNHFNMNCSTPGMSSEDGNRTPDKVDRQKKKKTKWDQTYRSSWEKETEFKAWLLPSSQGKNKAFCRCCNIHLNISAGLTDLRRHASTKKHKDNCLAIRNQRSVFEIPSVSNNNTFKMKTKISEIHLAAFIAEHDIAFNVAEHLPNLIRTVCPDSEIAKNIHCSRTKTASLTKNVIGEHSKEELVSILQTSKFSLIVDESTDKGCIKHLALVARVAVDGNIKDYFLALIPVQDATAATLFNSITEFFSKENIDYKTNMVGFGSDGANVMLGAHNSLASRLKAEIPGIFIMKCICHSFALCASYACLKLPRGIEDLARNIYNHFQSSPKRMGALEEFQHFVHVKPHKILHPSQTRWLSLESVVTRLLEQYDALKLYFISAIQEERLTNCEMILSKLNDPTTKLFLMFLEFILPIFNSVNKMMQSEKPQIYRVETEVKKTLKTFLDCYLKEEFIESSDLNTISPTDPRNFVNIKDMYLGVKVSNQLEHVDIAPEAEHYFRLKCLDFLIESAEQIKKRFPFDDRTFEKLRVLNPDIVKTKEVKSIAPLLDRFKNIVEDSAVQEIDTQWRLLRNTDEVISSGEKDVINF